MFKWTYLHGYGIMRVMELSRKFNRILIITIILVVGVFLGGIAKLATTPTFAEGDEESLYDGAGAKFVIIYDGIDKMSVRTDARTVEEVLDRAKIELNEGDIVDPRMDSEINADNYFINIHRARPVVVRDGSSERYLMSASYDAVTIAKEAGLTIYDGDEVKMVTNENFLEAGLTNVYEIERNGGRTITEEVELAYDEQTVADPNLENGKTEVRQLGEVGAKKVYYNVFYVDNEEVSREVVREEVIREPVTRITAVGSKQAPPPAAGTCADWVRAAGVPEADVAAAVDLINHESGCRVNAANPSGAYGIPQALPGSKMSSAGSDWETNPVTQIRWMSGYVNRYGGWQGARNYWYAHGWY